MELGRFTQHEELDKNKKYIYLKATTSHAKVQEETSYDEDSDSSDIDDEAMALLMNKFSKLLRKNLETQPIRARMQRIKSLGMNEERVENNKNESRDIKAKKAHIVSIVPEEEATSSFYDL
ncbi:hypothetical protein Lal_00026073 [Lupinus albus]|nr:hypothetical protein Lal_00026073 [Lupinus albus]